MRSPLPLNRYWRLLARYLRPQRRRVLALALLLAASIALQLSNPQLLRYFIDHVAAGGLSTELFVVALLFIAIALVNQVISVAATYTGENVGWTATNALRADLAAHCLRLDLSFHKAHTPGEIIERIDGDVTALSNFFSQLVIDVLGNAVLVLGVLVLLFREDWRVGLGLSAFAGLALLLLVRIRGFAVPYWIALRQISGEYFGFLGEQLAGTEDVRASGATAWVMRRFYEFLRRRLAIRWRASLAMTAMWITTLAVFTAGTAAAFALGAALWNAGAVSIGTVYLIFYYTELLRRPIEQIRTQLQDLQRADASIARVEGLLATHSRLADGPGRPLLPGPLAVEVDRVSFSYEDGNEDSGAPGGGRPGERALHDVNFGLAPGAVLGLLGRTGSGKTTLARLLLRLYDPTAGEIRLSGVPLRAQRLADLRRHVALVTQDVQLFHATVRDNLTFFDRAISDAQLLAVVEELGLGDWYSRLPAGLDSPLAAGTGLSAGEAQLLAFVRVFLKDPGLVILDEASARLDPATEQLLDRAIARLLSGRTGIIIAHRLSTLQRAGQIMILEHGRILEHGDRAELAAAPDSRFHTLLRAGLEEVLA